MRKSTSSSSRTFTIAALCGMFLGASALQSSFGSSLDLTFSSATPGTIEDTNNLGTGFTTRLSGTDTNNPDSRLNLDISNGSLDITGTNPGSDFNGQSNVALIEAPGVTLSSLGIVGMQDFTVTAVFDGAPAAAFNDYAQYGVYVGTASNDLTRAGFVNVSSANGPQFHGASYYGNNNHGGDADDNFDLTPTFSTGDSLTVSISRTNGVFSETVNGVDVTPPVNPDTYLGLDSTLTVGIFSLNTNGADPFTLEVDSFTVVPEPTTWAMMFGGLAMLVAFQRLRARRTQV
jgi:hypothetical protein